MTALALGFLLAASSCSEPIWVSERDQDEEASDGMRIAVLKHAAKTNGFVRSVELEVPTTPSRNEVGRRLFESRLMSINGAISCRDCHLDKFGSGDALPNAIGVGGKGEGKARMHSGGRVVPRNALSLWGRGERGFNTFFWDGKVALVDGNVVSQFGNLPPSNDPLVVAVHLPSVELREMVGDTPAVRKTSVKEDVSAAQAIQRELAERFARDPAIGPMLAKAYAKSAGEIEFGDVGDALASFIRHEFRIRPTRLESFVYDDGPITRSELAGGILFYGRGRCAACHGGPYFSDLDFHAVAFPQVGFGKNGFGVDEGRYNVTLSPADRYLFRTPPLFNVTKTAPYSHSGSVSRLADAIIAHFDPLRLVDTSQMELKERTDLYARFGPASRELLPATLTDEEVSQLVDFLGMLEFGPGDRGQE